MPQEEIDLLASQVSWKPTRELEHADHPSQDGGSSVRDVDSIGKLHSLYFHFSPQHRQPRSSLEEKV